MRLFALGKISIKLIYPFLYSFFSITRSLAYLNDAANPYISTLFSSLGQATVGLLEIISRIKQKKDESKLKESTYVAEERQIQPSEYEYLKSKKERMKKKICHLFIILGLSLLNSAASLVLFALENLDYLTSYNFQNEVRFIGIFYIIIICRFIFKAELYRHHFLSLGIITFFELILIAFCIIIFSRDDLQIGSLLAKFFILLCCDLAFSSKHVVDKWLMDKQYISPFLLLGLEGVFSTIINILTMYIFHFIPCSSLFIICKDRKGKTFYFPKFWSDVVNFPLFIVIFYFSSIGIELFITLTNKHYSPAYRPIFDCFSSFVDLFINTSGRSIPLISTKLLPYKIIIYICIFISTLIYNEIIILKFCKLDRNIKYNIDMRGEKELDSLLSTFSKGNQKAVMKPEEILE